VRPDIELRHRILIRDIGREAERVNCVARVLGRIGDVRTSPRESYTRAEILILLETLASEMEHPELERRCVTCQCVIHGPAVRLITAARETCYCSDACCAMAALKQSDGR
jgi:hypothetical protein